MVALARDAGLDSSAAQVGAVGPGRVGPVRQNLQRAGPGPTGPAAGNPDAVEDRGELRAVTTVPGRDDGGQDLTALFTGKMRLGAPPAPRTAQRVIGRFGMDPARWFFLPVAVTTGTGRVMMGTADRGVDADTPVDAPGSIGSGLQPRQDASPCAITLPTAEPSIQRLPRGVVRGHVTPWRTGAYPPPYAVDDLSSGPLARSSTCAGHALAAPGQWLRVRPACGSRSRQRAAAHGRGPRPGQGRRSGP